MDDPRPPLFRVLNEIGIINQLATAALEKQLPDGLHPSQFVLLGNLMRLGDGKTPKDLAQAFQVPKASMANTLMQLERRGLIRVEPHAKDGRKKLVYLSEAGRTLYIETIKSLGPATAEAVKGVEGLEEILPVLEELRKRLDANRAP